MAYADYTFYTDEFLGNKIAESDFPRLSARASDYIYFYTKGLADNAQGKALEMVKKATCAVAEVLQDEQASGIKRMESDGSIVASETVGAWSKSYATGLNVSEAQYMEQQKKNLLMLYLGNLPEFAGLFRVKSYRCVHEARRCGW